MPIGVIRYRLGSTARSTWAAVVHDTSCSADWPPKITTRLIRRRHPSSSPSQRHGPHRSLVIDRTVPFGLVRILASEAAAAVGGRLVGPDVEFDGVSFDSRSIEPGQLFVPIVAERDGHEFIGQARASGAVVHHDQRARRVPRDGTAIEVTDTSIALMALAQWARRRLSGHRRRRHRQRRQDVDEGSHRRGVRVAPAHHRPTCAASTTSRVCPSRSSTHPTTPRCSCWRWACAASARSARCARWPDPTSAW